jgi:hypothetical protein
MKKSLIIQIWFHLLIIYEASLSALKKRRNINFDFMELILFTFDRRVQEKRNIHVDERQEKKIYIHLVRVVCTGRK